MGKKLKIAFIAGLSSWTTLAVFTLINFKDILLRKCYFGNSWLFCSPDLSVWMRISLFFLITIIFTGFFYLAPNLWKILKSDFIFAPKIKAIIIALVLISAFLVVPFGSGDTSFYFNAGKAVNAGINPYVSEWHLTNIYGFPVAEAKTTGIMYGPAILYIFYFFYLLSGGNYLLFIILWKILMILFVVLCGWLCRKIIKEFSPSFDTKNFYVFWLLQPLILFEWVGNGHFDGVWIACLLAAIYFGNRKKWWMVWALLTLGIWIKLIPALVLPWFLIWWWQSASDNWQKAVKGALAGIAISSVITYLAWAKFWGGSEVFAPIILQSKWAVASIFSAIYYSFFPLFTKIFGAGAHWILTRLVHATIFAAVIFALFPYLKKFLLAVVRKYQFEYVEIIKAIFFTLTIYLLVWQKSFWPWYITWLLPIGFILYSMTPIKYLKNFLAWLSAAPFIFYILWLAAWLGYHADATTKLWFYYAIVLIVYAYPLVNIFKWRRINFEQNNSL